MYNVGVIGTGRIAFLLKNDHLRIKPCTHAGAIIKNKKLTITSACDIDTKRLILFSKKYKIKNTYTNYIEMLHKEKLDVVVISTWSDSHKPIIIEAAKTDVKIIVCEKPLSFNSKDCKQITKICKKYDTHLIINHERRWDPMYKKLKKMLNNEKIGKIRTVTANILTNLSFNKKSFLIDKSSLLHDGTHLIDLALFLFGDIKSVKGIIPKKRKDTVYGCIEFKNNIYLFLEAGGDREYFNFEFDIQGTNGRIKIGNEYKELWIKEESKRYLHFYELEKKPFPKIPVGNQFIEEYKEVVDLLEGKIKKSTSSGEDSYKILKIIEKLIK